MIAFWTSDHLTLSPSSTVCNNIFLTNPMEFWWDDTLECS